MYQSQLSILGSIFLVTGNQLVIKGTTQIYRMSTTRRKGVGVNATVFVDVGTYIHVTLETKPHQKQSLIHDSYL